MEANGATKDHLQDYRHAMDVEEVYRPYAIRCT